MENKDPEFLREEWALYAVGTLVILLRFATRIKTVGLRGFQGDDFFSLLALAFYTLSVVSNHVTYHHGTNVEAAIIEKTRALTDDEIKSYIIGSKSQLVAWYGYTAVLWCLKGTMLCFFSRLTIGLWQHRFMKWLAVTCAVSYVAVLFTLTFGCFPFPRNWQVVPDPGEKCTLSMQNFLVTVVLNVLTDAAILAIPLPLLWKLKVPVRQKAMIAVLLCPGLFMIAAAIVRVVLSLVQPGALNTDRWGVREVVVGIVAANLPILRSLWSKSFWSASSRESTMLPNDTARNPCYPSRPYDFRSSSLTDKRRDKTWEEEAVVGIQHLEYDKSDISSRPRMSGDSSEYIMQERGMAGVTVQTSYQVSYQISREDDGETLGPAWEHGGTSKATVQARADV